MWTPATKFRAAHLSPSARAHAVLGAVLAGASRINRIAAVVGLTPADIAPDLIAWQQQGAITRQRVPGSAALHIRPTRAARALWEAGRNPLKHRTPVSPEASRGTAEERPAKSAPQNMESSLPKIKQIRQFS